MTARQTIAAELGERILQHHEAIDAVAQTKRELEQIYRLIADCIRSDQMSHADVVKLLQSDEKFADWYRQHGAAT